MSGATPTATPPRSPNSQEDDETGKESAETELAKEDDDISARAVAAATTDLHRNILPDLFRPGAGEPNIIPESVHYVGYFSNHEQSMQTVVQVSQEQVSKFLIRF